MTDKNTAFNYQMPPEYVSSTQDVINALSIKIEAPVLFCNVWSMLSENGKKKNVGPYDVFSFLLTCKNLHLNPLLKQIYGFESKGKVVTVISIEGWNEIANRHAQFDGFDYEFPAPQERQLTYNKTTFDGGYRKVTPVTVTRKVSEYIICKVYRKDRSHPISVTTFYDEASTGSEPWATMPMQMLQNRALVNAIKKAFNVNAYAEDDRSYMMPTYQEIIENDTAQTEPVALSDSAPADVPAIADNSTGAQEQSGSLLAGLIPVPMQQAQTASTETQTAVTADLPPAMTSKPQRKRTTKKTQPQAEPQAEPQTAEVSDPSPTVPLEDQKADDSYTKPHPSDAEMYPPLPPLPPLKPEKSAPDLSKLTATALDLAKMLMGASDKVKLQYLGNIVAQFKELPETDKQVLRDIYHDKLEAFNAEA